MSDLTLTTAAQTNITSVGALAGGSIASGFGAIDNGASNITTGGLLKLDVDADANDVTGDSATGRLTLGASEDLNLYHGGTDSYIVNDTGDLILKTGASDEDILFQGNDGGSSITALTLDMSAAGAASFNGLVTANAGVVVDNITIDGTEIDLSSGNLTIDVAGNIILDADGGDVEFKDGGTKFASIELNSTEVYFEAHGSDHDIKIRGNDGGSTINMMSFDTSDAGAATLNNGLTLTDGNLVLASGHGISFAATADSSATNASTSSEILDDYEEGTWTPVMYIETGSNFSTDYQYGHYTKIGRMVHVEADIQIDKSGGTNNLWIQGLPFNVQNGNVNYHGNWFAGKYSGGDDYAVAAMAAANTDRIYMLDKNMTDGSDNFDTNTAGRMANSTNMIQKISVTYFTD